MAKKIVFFVLLIVVLAAVVLTPAVEAKAPEAGGIPADFASYRASPGEIWIWESGVAHPALIRCVLGQQEGMKYPPSGSISPASYASCGANFDVAKFAIAIGGEPVTCAAGFSPAEMQVNCKKMGK